MDNTREFRVLLDIRDDDDTPTNSELVRAIYRAIEYALDNDIAGAEALHRHVVGQVQVDFE